jgi:hypothetical protein
VDFSRISIGIKTILRDEKLFKAIDGIRRTMPGAQIIIADDGEHTEEKDGLYAELIREGHKVILCPYDSGFGYKSNEIVRVLDREFYLSGSDDFDFSPPSVALGIEKMLGVLDKHKELSVVSGRVNERPYEFILYDGKYVVFEEPFLADRYYTLLQHPYEPCDLTVNYSLIRKKVFEKVRWDDDQKIGQGEHGAFFVDLKRAMFRVAYVRGVNINSQEGRDSDRYRALRARASSPERSCFDKRGIKKYVLASGQVDYEKKDQ